MSQFARVVLAGGSGFLGKLLIPWLAREGWDVVALTRRRGTIPPPAREVLWDGANFGPWREALDGATAVINLAGRSVNCRYHARNRRAILLSRIDSTRALGEAIAAAADPPAVWLNSSTATIYKHSFDRPMTEATGAIGGTREAKDEFSVKVATAWEEEFYRLPLRDTRRVALRTAMVFGREPGTVYPILRRLAKLGLAGPLAGGQQYVSWIHEQDFCRALSWLLARDDLEGPVNVAAPQPLTNAELMRLVRAACGRRFGLPASRWMLELGAFFLRTETELLIKSRRVVPERLLNSGFTFLFPDLPQALAERTLRGPGTMADREPRPLQTAARCSDQVS